MAALLSVVTPCLNPGPLLRLCAASVADQDGPLEHLVQDGASTDGTAAWALSQPGLRTDSRPDRGMYEALNRGFGRARGDLFCWLNADEQLLPGAIRAVRAFFTARPETELLVADSICVDPGGAYLFHRTALPPLRTHTARCHLATPSCALFFRRHLWETPGLQFNPDWRCAGDADWILRILASGCTIARLPVFTSLFTLTGHNLSDSPEAALERARLSARLGPWPPRFLVSLHHRLRQLAAGAYTQTPFQCSAFTLESPDSRVTRAVPAPRGRWRTPD